MSFFSAKIEMASLSRLENWICCSISTSSKNIKFPFVGLNDFGLAFLTAGMWLINLWLIKDASSGSLYLLQCFDVADAVTDDWVILMSLFNGNSPAFVLFCAIAKNLNPIPQPVKSEKRKNECSTNWIESFNNIQWKLAKKLKAENVIFPEKNRKISFMQN